MSDVLYIPDLAQRLGLSEKAVRRHLERDSGVLPHPFRLGRRLAWRRVDVEQWLEVKAGGGEPRRRPGRPRRPA